MNTYHKSIFLLFMVILTSCGAGKKAQVRQQKIDTVINTARGYLGTPYKWGGTTKAGLDCSGLLCNSFRQIKYELPRTSISQSKVGEKVGRKELKPGDLVFFATGRSRRKITHVGLVTRVNRGQVKFIHSSSSRGVIETNLESDYYKKRFRTARRPF